MILSGVLKDAQGNTDELVFLAMIGVSALVVFTGYDLFHLHNAFNAGSFSLGFAGIIGACGLGVGARNLMNSKGDDVH